MPRRQLSAEERIRRVRAQQQAAVAARAAARAAEISRGPRPRVVDDAIEMKRGGSLKKKRGPKHKGGDIDWAASARAMQIHRTKKTGGRFRKKKGKGFFDDLGQGIGNAVKNPVFWLG